MSGPNNLADVSRETSDRLKAFEALVLKWNPAINLISRASAAEIWTRHILDSAQIFKISGVGSGKWADLGSGGGFPAIVVAILAKETAPDLRVTCIESDLRKAAFLTTAIREFGLNASVLSRRIEDAPPQNANVVSARALASLPKLLEYSSRHLAPGGIALFLKGQNVPQEIEAARAEWSFDCEEFKSLTDPNATVLKIGDISRG